MAKWKGDPFPQDWEHSHVPLDDKRAIPPPHNCDRCGQQSTEAMPVQVSKHVRGDTQDFRFCSRECHDQFYLDRMRSRGI